MIRLVMPREIVKLNGTATEVELVYAQGKEGRNDNGPFHTYTLAGGKIMFAKPELNAAIQSMSPHKGMRLSIQLGAGNQWDVRRVDPPASEPAPEASRTPVHRQAEPVPAQVQYGQAFGDFLILATDAVRSAERNSPAGSVRFDNRDVAAIATSMWIAADRAGFLTWNGAAQGGR